MFDPTQLRNYRRAQNLSVKSLAEKLGVSRPYINLIESGKRTPSSEVQRKLEEIMAHHLHIGERLENSLQTSEQKISKCGYEFKRNMSTSHHPQIPIQTLLGMVRGTIVSMETMIRNQQLLENDYSFYGTTSEFESPPPKCIEFQFKVSSETVVLSITGSNTQDFWVSLSNDFGVSPDVVLSHSSGTIQPVIELVWFTGYASLYIKVRKCNEWKCQSMSLTILDNNFRDYISNTS